ncbi:RNA polymerase sigma factor [Persicirhabdus sediminis]|uniref:Sigma-70 family RNA polymerase sigma factor n=1 Tax=Persicirhabdus sediminis TaxID=454144 RepID=A0A8J7SI26_9BACT|nr:sigma-70 family RNA polymerase sigma factor [Persicirhabdus sediminis]MBK1790244.1 sigma-70 family RNA polymerase sigma factor [Persicirhabdus sediminis]
MPDESDPKTEIKSSAYTDDFPDTRWSVILTARSDSDDAGDALDQWCRSYWKPINAYVKARGVNDPDETTQAFFVHMLEKKGAGLPDNTKGKLRAYLMRSVKHFITDQWRKQNAQKRGSNAEHVGIEFGHDIDENHEQEPDKQFERRWALNLMERAMQRLEHEMAHSGKGLHFKYMKTMLSGGEDPKLRQEAIETLGMTSSNFRIALYRVRKRYRHLLEDEIMQTVTTREEFEDELNYFMSLWS